MVSQPNVYMYRPGSVTRPTCAQVILLTSNHFPFALSPSSTRQRMASERFISRFSPHASTCSVSSDGRRTALTGSTPPAFLGRPRYFLFTEINFFIFLVYRKSKPRGRTNFRPGSNRGPTAKTPAPGARRSSSNVSSMPNRSPPTTPASKLIMFGDPVVATALLDRLLHHAVVIQIEGFSYRLRQHADLVPEHIRSNALIQPSSAPTPSKRRGRPPKNGAADHATG